MSTRMSTSASASKGLAAQAKHKVNPSLQRTPSFSRSTTPRTTRASGSTSEHRTLPPSVGPRASGSTSVPKLDSNTTSQRATSQPQTASPRVIQARTSSSRQSPRAASPERLSARKKIEPLRSSGSLTPRSAGSASAPRLGMCTTHPSVHRYRDGQALALLARQLDEFSRRKHHRSMYEFLKGWGTKTAKTRLCHEKIGPLCMRLWRDRQSRMLAQFVNAWACFALRERAVRAERQLAAERAALRHLSEELEEVRRRLRQAETRDDIHVSRMKGAGLDYVEEIEEQAQSRQTKEDEAEAEAEPTEPEPQPTSLRPEFSNETSPTVVQEFDEASADKLEERVGAMIDELHKPASLPWPETPRVDAATKEHRSPACGEADAATQGSDGQQRRAETTQDSSRESTRVGAYPGRTLLRRLAGPKGKRRGLLDSSSDSD